MDPVFALPLPVPALAGGSPLYCTGEESLQLLGFSSAAGVTLLLTGRFLPVKQRNDEPEPRVSPLQKTLVLTSDRVVNTRTEQLGEGWLLDWQVNCAAGSPAVGQVFAQVLLARGATGALQVLSLLGQGYVTAKQRLSASGAALGGFLDSGGAVRSITGTLPAAGAEISEVVPTGARWELIAFEADLTTSAAAANRVPQLTLDDGATIYARVSVNQNEVASHAWRNSFQRGVPQTFDGTRFIVTSPLGCDLVLAPGHRIRTVTASIDVGDQYAAPQYLVREFLEGA